MPKVKKVKKVKNRPVRIYSKNGIKFIYYMGKKYILEGDLNDSDLKKVIFGLKNQISNNVKIVNNPPPIKKKNRRKRRIIVKNNNNNISELPFIHFNNDEINKRLFNELLARRQLLQRQNYVLLENIAGAQGINTYTQEDDGQNPNEQEQLNNQNDQQPPNDPDAGAVAINPEIENYFDEGNEQNKEKNIGLLRKLHNKLLNPVKVIKTINNNNENIDGINAIINDGKQEMTREDIEKKKQDKIQLEKDRKFNEKLFQKKMDEDFENRKNDKKPEAPIIIEHFVEHENPKRERRLIRELQSMEMEPKIGYDIISQKEVDEINKKVNAVLIRPKNAPKKPEAPIIEVIGTPPQNAPQKPDLPIEIPVGTPVRNRENIEQRPLPKIPKIPEALEEVKTPIRERGYAPNYGSLKISSVDNTNNFSFLFFSEFEKWLKENNFRVINPKGTNKITFFDKNKDYPIVNKDDNSKKPKVLFNIKLVRNFQSGKGEKDILMGLQLGLTTDDINDFMRNVPNYLGTVPIDKISDLKIPEDVDSSFIMNTDISTKQGKHWIAVYISPKKDKSIEYYDSLANEPKILFLKEIKELIDKLKLPFLLKLKINRIKTQGDSRNCGLFAMKFIIDRINNKKFKIATKFNDVKNGERNILTFGEKFGFI